MNETKKLWEETEEWCDLIVTLPPSDFRAFMKERVLYIRGLIMKAEIIDEKGENPTKVIDRAIEHMTVLKHRAKSFYAVSLADTQEMEQQDLPFNLTPKK
jgi:hypothetical protein